jgi:hypothetical protein
VADATLHWGLPLVDPSHPADKRLAAQSPMAIGRCRSWLLVSIEFLPSDDRDVADFEALWWSHE